MERFLPPYHITLRMMFALLIVLAVFGCHLNPSNTTISPERRPGEPITVSGQLGEGLSVARTALSSAGDRSIAGAVSGIASIKVIAGNAGVGPDTNVLPVQDDGRLSASLDAAADESWLLLLVNEDAATLEEKASGFISIRDSSGVDLSLLPLGNAKRNLDFGLVSIDDAGVASEYLLETQANTFAESFASLLETAYRDNLFKHAKNLYVNLNTGNGQWLMERTRCYATGSTAHAENSFMPVAQWIFTPGFNMRIDAEKPFGHDFTSIASGIDDIEIVPPEPITIKNTDPPFVFSADSPLLVSVASALPPGSAFWLLSDTGRSEADGGYVVEFDGEENLGNGLWRFNLLNGDTKTELALFDIQSADPFTDDTHRAFIYYLPSVHIETDVASKIISVALSWFAWDPAAQVYHEVTDFTTFSSLIEAYTIGIVSVKTDSDGEIYNDEEAVNNMPVLVPLRASYLRDVPEGGTKVDWVRINYAISGVEYFFTLYPKP